MKGSNAAPRDATARPAWEQELQDVKYHPVFQNEGTVIRSVGRWANCVKHRFFGRPWNIPHENLCTDDPDHHSQTFEYKQWKVRMDRFPWLDLADKPTIDNSPFEQRISKHMASAMMPDCSIDDYARYFAADDQECPCWKLSENIVKIMRAETVPRNPDMSE